MAKSNRVMYWFRTDLRLHDSPALHAALALDPAVLWPIFTWDPHYVYRARGGLNRWQYLLDCQADLSASITALNPRSKLLVVREAPQTVLPKLFKAWRVTHLVFEKDTDAYARARDADVVEAARRAGVEVVVRPGRTLWDSDDLVQRNAGKPTMSLAQLQKAAAQMGPVARPLPPPDALPDPGETPLEGVEQDVPAAEPDVNAKWRRAGGGDAPPGRETAYAGASVAGPHADFAIETLAELGYAPATTPHRGGETRALARLADVVADLRYAATFRKPQTSPAAVDAPATTLLSPALHFGALSVRELYWRVRDAVERYKKEGGAKAEAPSQPPESLEGQLLFRDMYFAAQAAIGPKFTQEAGNPHCRFVPWHLPSRLDDEGMTTFEYEVDDPRAEEWFTRWEHGRTGFPWIDALMRQLRQEGWIHRESPPPIRPRDARFFSRHSHHPAQTWAATRSPASSRAAAATSTGSAAPPSSRSCSWTTSRRATPATGSGSRAPPSSPSSTASTAPSPSRSGGTSTAPSCAAGCPSWPASTPASSTSRGRRPWRPSARPACASSAPAPGLGAGTTRTRAWPRTRSPCSTLARGGPSAWRP